MAKHPRRRTVCAARRLAGAAAQFAQKPIFPAFGAYLNAAVEHCNDNPGPAALRFERATGCAEYPEMPLGVIGETFKGRVDAPVLGFAEVHTHMAMGSEMSDGSRDVGPSAGGVMYGQAVNRFGGFHARVVWQQRDKVGLQFLEDAVLVTKRIVST